MVSDNLKIIGMKQQDKTNKTFELSLPAAVKFNEIVGHEMRIRRFQEDDRDEVVSLHRLAMESAGGYIPGPWDKDFDSIQDTYLNGRGEFLVWEVDGKIIVMGALLPVDAETAEVKRIRVSPAVQGQGLGQKMLSTLEERARELGFMHLKLDTPESNEAARKLFSRNGYIQVGSASFEGHKQLLFCKELGKGA